MGQNAGVTPHPIANTKGLSDTLLREIAATGGVKRYPANAVLITVWQSGSVRFHAGREIVMWDSLDPAWLDRAILWLKSTGKQPYVLLERREEPDFRERFREQSDLGRLDWPPRFDLNRQVRIFDPDDRVRYLAGEAYPTENLPLRQSSGGQGRPNRR